MSSVGKMFGFGGGGNDSNDAAIAQQQAEEARKAGLRSQINALYGLDGNAETLAKLKAEEDDLSSNLNQFYTAQGKDEYDRASRNLRFGAARAGGIGGSEYADEEALLNKNNALGSTRIADAVKQAINGLRAGRETSRLNSIQLVNSGSGADAVQSAGSGLKAALDTASAANKGNLFTDLFQNLAFAKQAGSNNASNSAAIAALFGGKNPAYYSTPGSSGTVQS